MLPLGVDPEAPDAELLSAVVDHWHQTLAAADECDAILSSLGISMDSARRLRIGISDRTFGKRLPDRQLKAGLVLPSRLCGLGILRESAHEAFRGCVVIPVTDASGTIVGIFGRRLDRSAVEIWAEGLPGGVFTAGCAGFPTLVVPSILDALAVIGAGPEVVVAPDRKRGFLASDRAALVAEHDELIVTGRGAAPLAAKPCSPGTVVSIAGRDVDVSRALASASDRCAALAALLADRRTVELATDTGSLSGTAQPVDPPQSMNNLLSAHTVATGGAQSVSADNAPDAVRTTALIVTSPAVTGSPTSLLTVTQTNDRDEVFVHAGSRSWRIRGAGARANSEGELLRVALSVTDSTTGRFHLDTLDLDVARQRSGFLDSAATELRVDRDVLAAELAEVIAAGEQCNDEARSKGNVATPEMIDAERASALEFLRAPDLVDRLAADLAALGVVGEQINLLVCYLATISRLCERPFGVLIQSSSAAGKSTLTDAVCSLVPGEDLVSLSAIISQAPYYLGGGDLSRKVLNVAEEASASYALKLLLSEGKLSIATTGKDCSSGRLSTSSYEIRGPVALVMTTTATDIDPELENRLVMLGVDEDPAQTRAIVDAQREAASLSGLLARSARHRVQHLHANAQRLLRPFPVVIPEMGVEFPATATRHRRDHAKLVSIISALTLLHQHQRQHKTLEFDGTTLAYLEATVDDVERGLALARTVLVRGADHLVPQTARLLDAVISSTTTRAHTLSCAPTEVPVTRRELRELLGWSDVQVRRATDRLVALEYLVVAGGGRGRCRTYSSVADLGPVDLLPSGRCHGPVGHLNGPFGHQGRRTSHPGQPGETDQLVTLVGLDEDRVGDKRDVDVDDVGIETHTVASGLTDRALARATVSATVSATAAR